MHESTRRAIGLYYWGGYRGSTTVWLEQLDVLGHCVASNTIAAEALKCLRPIGAQSLNGLTAIDTWCLDSLAALSTQELYSLMATSAW